MGQTSTAFTIIHHLCCTDAVPKAAEFGDFLMQAHATGTSLTDRLVNGLHVEAMVLADEVRAYFDEAGRAERDRLPALERVAFSCESLKVTTRLMHVIGWLLTRRAVAAGEIGHEPIGGVRRLGMVADSDAATIATLPETARGLIAASRELHARAARLEAETVVVAEEVPSPARTLLSRLERVF